MLTLATGEPALRNNLNFLEGMWTVKKKTSEVLGTVIIANIKLPAEIPPNSGWLLRFPVLNADDVMWV